MKYIIFIVTSMILLFNAQNTYSQKTDFYFRGGLGISKMDKKLISFKGPGYGLTHLSGTSYYFGTGISKPLKKWMAIDVSLLFMKFGGRAIREEQPLGILHIDNRVLYGMASKYAQKTKAIYLSLPISLEFKTKYFSILPGFNYNAYFQKRQRV